MSDTAVTQSEVPSASPSWHGPARGWVQVTGDAPSAVLLVDLATRQVVYANPVAEQLAPQVKLPASVDAWSDAAQLRDPDGDELSDTEHPLSRVARSEPAPGQAVSAARATEMGRKREPLWAIGFPMKGAPQLDDHALIVLLPLRRRSSAEAVATAADLRDRAVLATGIAFTVADARSADLELLWVNPAFTATTGYSFEESVGRNCRFLQGPDTDPTATAAMGAALREGREVTITVLNYRKDGSAFWNEVAMSPIFAPDGELTHYVGIQTDVTLRVAADEERDRALLAERAAREDAQRAYRRLGLLAEATSRLASTLDVRESLERLMELVVPELADWTLVALPDRNGEVGEVVARHSLGLHDELRGYTELLSRTSSRPSLLRSLLHGAPARLVNDYSGEASRRERSGWVSDTAVLDRSEELGAESVLFVPLTGRRHVVGAMVLLRGAGSPAYTEQDLSVAEDLGRRAGLILDNARLYQAEHRIAETLQRSLLPSLPELTGVSSAARYQASETGADVGGDFYELIKLPGDAVGFAIGDIVGHDVYAAAAMGHLRGLMRACAWDVEVLGGISARQQPAAVLERVDRLVQGLESSTLATVTYGRLDRNIAGTWTLAYSNAGHPPALLRTPDGQVEVLKGADDLLLGVQESIRTGHSREVEPGSMLVLYTDGLVERRGESLDVGVATLAEALAAAPHDVEAVCDTLLAVMGDSDDDVAVLAIALES